MPRLVAPAITPGSMAATSQPVLTADGLTLRPWRASDAEAVVAAYSDPAIQRWHARSMNHHEALDWISTWSDRWRSETGAGWAVVDDEVCGQIGLRSIDPYDGVAEISYWVVPRARDRRVASRALATLTDWAFDELGLHRLEVEHSTHNAASCRVAERAGYGAERTKSSSVLHADGWHDMHAHARIAVPAR